MGLVWPTATVPRPSSPQWRQAKMAAWAGVPSLAHGRIGGGAGPCQPVHTHAVVIALRPHAVARSSPAVRSTRCDEVATMSIHSDWKVHRAAPRRRGLTRVVAQRGGSGGHASWQRSCVAAVMRWLVAAPTCSCATERGRGW
jgi:hypothetical protein